MLVGMLRRQHQLQPVFPGTPVPLNRLCVPTSEVIEPPANRLIDLFATHFPGFERTQPLQDYVRQAVQMALFCHTSALGGHVERCPHGHVERIFYNSCGHRCCPRCAPRKRRKWFLTRQGKLLPIRHYHAVFTLPHTFNDLWHWNFQAMGNLLFQSAIAALKALLADPHWLGAEVGITVTLETWDDRLYFHPPLHCLVTGGGVRPDGDWVDVSNPRCLVAAKPVMWEFRKRFCHGLKQALQEEALTIPEGTTTRQWLNRLHKGNRQNWEVFIAKPPEDGGPSTEDILRYQAEDVAGGPLAGDRLFAGSDLSATQLAYLKSAPLHEARLEAAPEGHVSFWWGAYDPETGTRERTQLETLPVSAFFRRYLQHIPPPHYQTVRHYGLYTSAKKSAYDQCCELLKDRQSPVSILDAAPESSAADTSAEWLHEHTCPTCGQPLIVTAYIPSSLTGKVIPRLPIGHAPARSPAGEGAYAP
jgi:hypothetical protein